MAKKIHLQHPERYRTLCGQPIRVDTKLIDSRRQCVDEATCLNCHRVDDAQCIRNYRRECREGGVDPNTLEKLRPWPT